MGRPKAHILRVFIYETPLRCTRLIMSLTDVGRTRLVQLYRISEEAQSMIEVWSVIARLVVITPIIILIETHILIDILVSRSLILLGISVPDDDSLSIQCKSFYIAIFDLLWNEVLIFILVAKSSLAIQVRVVLTSELLDLFDSLVQCFA